MVLSLPTGLESPTSPYWSLFNVDSNFDKILRVSQRGVLLWSSLPVLGHALCVLWNEASHRQVNKASLRKRDSGYLNADVIIQKWQLWWESKTSWHKPVITSQFKKSCHVMLNVTWKTPESMPLSRWRGPGRLVKMEMDLGFCFTGNSVLTQTKNKRQPPLVAMKYCTQELRRVS